MKQRLMVLFLVWWVNGFGQLIPNGDFEYYTTCPSSLNQLSFASPWINPIGTSPDYFNQCAGISDAGVPYNYLGYQFPNSGNGYSGIIMYYNIEYREYIEVELTAELIAGMSYYFQMYIVCSNRYQYWSGNVGVYFSDTLIQLPSASQALPFTPQIMNNTSNIPDTLNWLLVDGIYVATGNEHYIVIGNFNDNANTVVAWANPSALWPGTYLYIDDVSLTSATYIDKNKTPLFSMFPTIIPSHSDITLNYPISQEESRVIIYDMNGHELESYSLPPRNNTQTVKLPQMAGGVYVARMVGEGVSGMVKFVVE
jgi:hypothetical protein